eukprot:TRINITY_DN7051_c0_g1_i3.p1 TRINITY_DN7051_c0_g1~~TRINITY_DN7051_c0_g1_i3.p1  ORF type:complete len:320 (-),score=53.23 TRINITY_DN7051_c0_g1_i3:79-1038(-)
MASEKEISSLKSRIAELENEQRQLKDERLNQLYLELAERNEEIEVLRAHEIRNLSQLRESQRIYQMLLSQNEELSKRLRATECDNSRLNENLVQLANELMPFRRGSKSLSVTAMSEEEEVSLEEVQGALSRHNITIPVERNPTGVFQLGSLSLRLEKINGKVWLISGTSQILFEQFLQNYVAQSHQLLASLAHQGSRDQVFSERHDSADVTLCTPGKSQESTFQRGAPQLSTSIQSNDSLGLSAKMCPISTARPAEEDQDSIRIVHMRLPPAGESSKTPLRHTKKASITEICNESGQFSGSRSNPRSHRRPLVQLKMND